MALQDDVNNFTNACSTACLLTLAASVYTNTTNRSVTVANVNSLPDLSSNTIIPGTVFFVNSIGVPVIAQLGCWTGLDNRVLRRDYDYTYAWGQNSFGQLGDGTIVTKSSPVSVVNSFIDWCQVSAGGCQSSGIRSNGTAWAWGANYGGQLGDGTTDAKISPVSVIGGFTDWCQVDTGRGHSLGVRTNGTAWAWGYNILGRLGEGTTVDKSSPVSVIGGFTNWCQVSAGAYHSLGVRTNGTAWAWGINLYGHLGDGTTVDKSSPVSVVGGFTDWCQISAGQAHSLGVRTNGTAWAWGCAGNGRLGDGTALNKSSPVSVIGGFTDWCQVSA
ncbi:MAG: RCC1 domain-containing protein, partial [Terrimicrobiaceae bacterium]